MCAHILIGFLHELEKNERSENDGGREGEAERHDPKPGIKTGTGFGVSGSVQRAQIIRA